MTTRIMTNLKNVTKVYSGIHEKNGRGCICGCRGEWYSREAGKGKDFYIVEGILNKMKEHWAECEIDGEYISLSLPLANDKTQLYVAYTK